MQIKQNTWSYTCNSFSSTIPGGQRETGNVSYMPEINKQTNNVSGGSNAFSDAWL